MRQRPATDCHAHIIDVANWPYAGSFGYHPGAGEQGDARAYLDVLANHGIGRGVLVQPSAYGTDNRAMLDAIARADGNLRGIAVLDTSSDRRQMRQFASDGVIGLRLNLSHDAAFFHRPGAEAFLDRAIETGLFVEVYAVADAWVETVARLRRPGLKLIIDHFGHPDCLRPLDQPGFAAVLGLAQLPDAVVKLSSPFRIANEPWPYRDADTFVAAAIAAFGAKRCIWGSDWPFIAHSGPVAYGEQLALVDRWFASPADRDLVLRDNPGRLFF